ncbi:MAG: hypothetical protein ACYSW3_08020 [Planctomycetota bacterium]|jgi:hypothetical protein
MAEQMQEESVVELAQDKDIATEADATSEPDTVAEQDQDQPPIEIKAIPQADSETPSSELAQTTPPEPEQNQPESS